MNTGQAVRFVAVLLLLAATAVGTWYVWSTGKIERAEQSDRIAVLGQQVEEAARVAEALQVRLHAIEQANEKLIAAQDQLLERTVSMILQLKNDVGGLNDAHEEILKKVLVVIHERFQAAEGAVAQLQVVVEAIQKAQEELKAKVEKQKPSKTVIIKRYYCAAPKKVRREPHLSFARCFGLTGKAAQCLR